ncbi:EamA family transporter [Campylobacter sp. MIT 12-5580]|uniref:DMT family transporter n=1 Tax=Campylobacter sp. MIT 12-5580 TaxID=2040651 RepID=UPI0010F99657|nr:DMT family transporter [Campylobacter sp. MIT 12-5580]TKX29802.1 EamA family transporter [Campylobacter sp. MIT 12-5580]
MLGVGLVLLGAVFWAISGVLAEYLFKSGFSVEWVSFYRLLFTSFVLIALSFKKRNFVLFKHKNKVFSLLGFALLGLLLTQYGYFKAIFYTDAGTATMIQYSAPLLIMIFVCFKAKVLPKKLEILALILIFIGLFLLATHGDFHSLNISFWGLFWALAGAFGVAYYSLGARAIIASYGLFFVMGFASLFAACMLFVLLGFKIPYHELDIKAFLAMSGIIFIGTIGAFCLYLKGVEYIGALKASMIACVEPVAAALMSFAFLGTRYTFIDIFAFILIILSVILNAKNRA